LQTVHGQLALAIGWTPDVILSLTARELDYWLDALRLARETKKPTKE